MELMLVPIKLEKMSQNYEGQKSPKEMKLASNIYKTWRVVWFNYTLRVIEC